MNKSVALAVIAISSSFVQPSASKTYWPSAGETGALCVERTEDMGWLNVVPVTIVVGQASTESSIAMTTLGAGGEAVCIYLPPAEYRLRLQWVWDQREPHPRAYTRSSGELNIVSHGMVAREVCSDSADHSGNPRWVIATRGECERLWLKFNTRNTHP
jgi:hypothetical protein